MSGAPNLKGVTASKLLREVTPDAPSVSSKITVVGAGMVGMAGVFAILTEGVCSDLALIDMSKDKVLGEKMDLMHGQSFFGRRVNVHADSDYGVSKGSKFCVITAGARQNEGETRLDLVQKNVGIFKGIVPNLVKYSPDTIIVVVSNPCDIMAWVTWKISKLLKNKVFSSGTTLDSSRFRYLIGERLGISGHSVHGYIIGEHGDSSVPCWSSVNIGGTRLKDICPTAGDETGDAENWKQVHMDVVQSAYEIIRLKGFTNWGIGLMICKLCETILKNQRTVCTVGTLTDGWNGITEEVFISIPAVIGERGVTHVVNQKLSDAELTKVRDSAKALRKVIDGIQL